MYSLLVFTSLLSLSFLFAGPFFCYFHCPPNNHRLTTSWTSWTSKTDGRFPSGKKRLGWPTLEQLITEKKGACYTRYIQISRWKIPDITRCVAVAVGKQAPGLETGFFFRTMLNGWRIQSAIKRNGLFQPIPKGNNQIGASESVCQFFLYLFETTKKSTYSQAHDTE